MPLDSFSGKGGISSNTVASTSRLKYRETYSQIDRRKLNSSNDDETCNMLLLLQPQLTIRSRDYCNIYTNTSSYRIYNRSFPGYFIQWQVFTCSLLSICLPGYFRQCQVFTCSLLCIYLPGYFRQWQVFTCSLLYIYLPGYFRQWQVFTCSLLSIYLPGYFRQCQVFTCSLLSIYLPGYFRQCQVFTCSLLELYIS